MYACPNCGSRSVEGTRTHTLYETIHLTYTDDQGTYEEEDAGSFGDSIDQGDWKDRECDECGTKWPDEPEPHPTSSVFILFGSERFLCGAYRTWESAEAAIRANLSDITDEPEGSQEWQYEYDEYEIVETPLKSRSNRYGHDAAGPALLGPHP